MNNPSIHCRSIIESDWRSILRIQAEVYYAIVPESESVMRSKAASSPKTCFVATHGDETILGYCLAYPYPPNQIPPLGLELAVDSNPQLRAHPERGTTTRSSSPSTANLFLHDMAVDNMAGGRGIAQYLFQQVVVAARSLGYCTMSLVAIQQASGFWSKVGFAPRNHISIDSSYASDAQFMTRNV